LNDSAIAYAYKYIARNPIVAGLCDKVEDYRFSTFYDLHRGASLRIPLVEEISPRFIPKDWEMRLDWLNRPSPKEYEALVGKALRRFEFGFSRGNEVRKQLEGLRLAYEIPLPQFAPATFSAEK
jgi:hypothetical protein